MHEDPYLSIAETAAQLGVTGATVRAQARKGKISTIKRARDLFVHADEIARYRLESQSSNRTRRRASKGQASANLLRLAHTLGVGAESAELHSAVSALTRYVRTHHRGEAQRLLRNALTLVLSIEHDPAASPEEREFSEQAACLIERIAQTMDAVTYDQAGG